MNIDPSPSGDNGNGRDRLGRFVVGNQHAKGNPHHKQVARLRSALLDAITVQDIDSIVKRLVAEAKNGDVIAAREILDRCLGKAVATTIVEAGDVQTPIKVYLSDAMDKV